MTEASDDRHDALTPMQFLDLASELLGQGLHEEFDVPEVWAAMAKFPREDMKVLFHFIASHPPRSPLVRGVHPMAQEIWLMLVNLAGYHVGAITAEQLSKYAAGNVAHYSQLPLVCGYAYHVRALVTGDDSYDLRDYICEKPFEQLDVLENSAHQCCTSWLHKPAGNLSEQSHEEVWSSDAAAAIRRSVLDGSYRYCSKIACPAISGRTLTPKAAVMHDPWWRHVIETNAGQIDRPPTRVNLAYDRHCNLSCPSCRTSLVTSNDEVRDRLDKLTQRNIYPLLRTAQEVLVTGSGDPFASRTFRKMLQWITNENCPDLKVTLMTNGMLFTEKEWAKFPNLKGKVKIAKISMDGASKETHELLRRGSKWEVMMKNLPFIGSLVAKGEIDKFELCFVVQQENYAEMGDFVDLAKKVGAQNVYFERLTNWATFTPEHFETKAVCSPNHPEHAAFLAALHDERLRDPIVVLGSLSEFMRPAHAKAA